MGERLLRFLRPPVSYGCHIMGQRGLDSILVFLYFDSTGGGHGFRELSDVGETALAAISTFQPAQSRFILTSKELPVVILRHIKMSKCVRGVLSLSHARLNTGKGVSYQIRVVLLKSEPERSIPLLLIVNVTYIQRPADFRCVLDSRQHNCRLLRLQVLLN